MEARSAGTWMMIGAALVAAFALGCGGGGEGKGAERTGQAASAVEAPPELRAAVRAERTVTIDEGAVVAGGDVVVDGESGAASSLTLGSSASIDSDRVASAESVVLGPGSSVGDLRTDALVNQGGTYSAVGPAVAAPGAPVSGLSAPGTAPVQVSTGTLDLEAGSYAALYVATGATLRLLGGVYDADSLWLANGAQIVVAAPSVLRLTGRLRLSDQTVTEPPPGSDIALDLRIEVGGVDEPGLPAALVGVSATATAVFVVPNGTLRIREGAAVVGSVSAKDVYLGRNASITSFSDDAYQGVPEASPCRLELCTFINLPGFPPVICTRPPVTERGVVCSDGDVCTGQGYCDGQGSCAPGIALVVDDGNPCTSYVCDPLTGGTQQALADGAYCDTDDDPCSGGGQCVSGQCQATPALPEGTPCSDGVLCNGFEVCNANHQCAAPAIPPAGTMCSDGDTCNGMETCDGLGACASAQTPAQAGTLCSVGSDGPCTLSACDGQGACQQASLAAGVACSDENPCTTGDACDGAGTCVGTVAEGAVCDDGDACNGAEVCDLQTGTCAAGAPVDVDDGDSVTLDTCDPFTGAVGHSDCSALFAATIGTTTIDLQAACLYTGPNPIQVGVDPATIDPVHAAILGGSVLDTAGQVLPSVRVTVLDHPEYGSTSTRADGVFRMAVNGGTTFTLLYEKPGYLPSQRQIAISWQDYKILPEVRLVAPSSSATVLVLAQDPADPTKSVTTQPELAVGPLVVDEYGSRRATVSIAPGTSISTGANGPVLTGPIHLRMTEYTVGPDGPDAMPATLPPTTLYTYAVEIAIDEADAAGVSRVDFSQPVHVYVDNFLGFPVGSNVPSGYYDEQAGVWKASEQGSGRVTRVLSVTGGLADLDIDGDGSVDNAASLAAEGVTGLEQQQLATLFPPGATFWRVPIAHLTTYDFNWGGGPPPGATFPDGEPLADDSIPDPTTSCGSLIEVENQVLRESIPLTGTPLVLGYSSDRVPGRLARLRVPLTDSNPPPKAIGVLLLVSVAGHSIRKEFPPAPDLNVEVLWNGLDSEGRALQGAQPATVTVYYRYPVKMMPGGVFGVPAGGSVGGGGGGGSQFSGGIMSRPPIDLGRTYEVPFGHRSSLPLGLSGFSLSAHHAYDVIGRTLYYGDGSRRHSEHHLAIESIGGIGPANPPAPPVWTDDDVPASQTRMQPTRLAIAPDGSVLTADSARVGRIVPATGQFYKLAGSGGDVNGYATGTPALSAAFGQLVDIAVAPTTGDVYVLDAWERKVARIDAGGIVHVVAGGGPHGFPATSQPGALVSALGMSMQSPSAIAVASDGSVYLGDAHAVYRIDTQGNLWLFAGQPTLQPCAEGVPVSACGDGGPADLARLRPVTGLLVGPDGTVFIAGSTNVIRAVTPDGIIHHVAGTNTNVAGNGAYDPSHEGMPANQVPLFSPAEMALSSDGSLYVADKGHRIVRRIRPPLLTDYDAQQVPTPTGPIEIILGRDFDLSPPPAPGECGVGNPPGSLYPNVVCAPLGTAQSAYLGSPSGIAIGPEGSIYVADAGLWRVLRARPPLPGFDLSTLLVPSEDGSALYVFDARGKHLETRDATTQQILVSFGYTPSGELDTVTDAFGGVTQVVRANGALSQIIAPTGQVTTFDPPDAHGFLTKVTNPAGESWSMTYVPPYLHADDPADDTIASLHSFGTLMVVGHGLLETFTDPQSHKSTLSYDLLGRIVSDADAKNNEKTLTRVSTFGIESVILTDWAPAGQSGATTVLTAPPQTGDDTTRFATAPDQTLTTTFAAAAGNTTTTFSDGTVVTTSPKPDPRFLASATYPGVVTIETGAGAQKRTMTVDRTKTVALSDPNDFTSVVSADDDVIVNGKLWTRHYDAATRTETVTSPLGYASSAVYDPQGRLVVATPPGLEPTTFAYDLVFEDRVKTVTVGSTQPRVTTHTWITSGPNAGELLRVTLPNDAAHETWFDYDLANRPTSIDLVDGVSTVGLGWDAKGNLTSWTTPTLKQHGQGYDEVDLFGSYVAPAAAGVSGLSTSFAYNPDRSIDHITRPDGHVITFGYEATTGKPTSVDFSDGASPDAIVMTYWPSGPEQGKLDTVAHGNVLLGFDYAGTLVSKLRMDGAPFGQPAAAYDVALDYDDDFQLTSEKLGSLPLVAYGYDSDGALASVGGLSITRDEPAPPLGTGYGTGLPKTLTLGSVVTDLGFDEVGALLFQSVMVGAQQPYVVTYDARDASGRILQMTETIGGQPSTYEYTYDLLGQLTDVEKNGQLVGHYTYDLNGNRDAAPLGPAVYDAQDRLTSLGGVPYAYNDAGQLVSKGAAGSQTTYTYDDLGNLRGVTMPDGTTYGYLVDGLGRRVGRLVNGAFDRGWVWGASGGPIAEVDATGQVRALFAYAGGGAPDVMWTVSGGAITATYRIVKDHLGGVRLVLDASTGAEVQRIDYDAWGNVLSDSNAGFQPFGFAGGLYDAATGLVRFGARDYDAEVGRWTAKDPIGISGGDTNLYGYVSNDPINRVDLEGTDALAAAELWLMRYGSYFGPASFRAAEAAAAAAGQLELVPIFEAGARAATLIDIYFALDDLAGSTSAMTEHTKGARPSTKGKHQKGESRKLKDKGGERGDQNRSPPRRPPPGHKGGWPPRKSCK